MSGIGNGFSSGIQSFNDHFLVYTGRQCPTSWVELKANISRNMKTCAKACTAFLDSSLGLAVSMGVVGIVATSLCAGEDMAEVIVTTLLPVTTNSQPTPQPTLSPLSNAELVYVCAEGSTKIPGHPQNTTKSANWTVGGYGICQYGGSIQDRDIFCISLQEYYKKFPDVVVPQCQAKNWTGDETYNTRKRYLTYVFVDSVLDKWALSNSMQCMMKNVYSMLNASFVKKSEKVPTTMCTPVSVKTSKDSTKAPDGIDRGAYCWDEADNMKARYPQYFADTSNCPLGISTTLAPTTTSTPLTAAVTTINTYTTAMSLTTDLSAEEDKFSSCNIVMIAFGVGSALVLMTTVGKILYKQCTLKGVQKPKSLSKKAKSFAALTLEEGFLLGASTLGTGTLLSSCGPIDSSTKKVAMVSTVLYWTSAANRLLGNFITGPVKQESTLEARVQELSKFTSSLPQVQDAETSDDEGGEGAIVPVVIVKDSPKGCL
ncbi:hypothetical protein CLAVI_001029 [Candidatus Clavichlamydia salmonicola]|uniref:hypothetical protein n=1 Tax=Candidatus Clavichlamydia salmonicola TaxID=469812 RepID=UPI0018916AD4|nr:hypothetical protein [Candidatus Clavichlamydia salmonicola]MBF5051385.1 hypothetical protein [Candidatus Clavichlamydia salmonicola]